MTREEQIQKLIDEETGIDNYGSIDYQVGVCDGVRLADKTMIEKACEWLKQNAKNYVVTCYDEGELNDEDLLNDFRKAMEE